MYAGLLARHCVKLTLPEMGVVVWCARLALHESIVSFFGMKF